ncbi:hypothetical protein F7725_010715 [Dissostichus mawsoni]|uniref:G domain-containing protein n=1 Tax=Dissostichus mawsoni TaxID=36200 RepID=A0A7J5XQU6_DISMA|nr:hypothetical protein F7725_010715 [Dissostichus mawsoni]
MLKLLGVLRVGRGLIHGGRVLIPGGRGLSGRSGRGFRGCTVDPGQEETFVFVDFTDAEPEGEKDLLPTPPTPPTPPPSAASPPQRLRALELQLHALGGGASLRGGGASLQGAELLFQDVEFPGGDSAVSLKKQKKKKSGGAFTKWWGRRTPLSQSVTSAARRSGRPRLSARQQVQGAAPGGGSGGAVCQRCHLLTHHNQALQVELSAEGYAAVVKRLRPFRVDLLPGDAPNYLQRIRRQLEAYCAVAGLQVSEVQLISAKTGFGIEQLVSRLQRTWSYRGDVYLVGSSNAGKSSLFNALLQSDYCKSRAADRLQRATVSPWPGTTLDLLKFPIINPTPYRMFRREERLSEERGGERELTEEEREREKHLKRQGYLTGRVGRTFRTAPPPRDEIQFDPDSLALGEEGEGGETQAGDGPPPPRQQGSEEQEGNWLYDTPGILKQHDILALLSEQEVMSVVPTQALVPRTFVLQEGASLLVGGLARIDFIKIPVHISSLERVQEVYEKHAGHTLLGVPAGGSERMKDFPPLVPQDFRLQGVGYQEAAGDLKLSSAGDQLLLRLHGPEDASFSLRTPPLLPHLVKLKGDRVRKSVAYRTLKHVVLQREEGKKKN